MNVIPETRHTH